MGLRQRVSKMFATARRVQGGLRIFTAKDTTGSDVHREPCHDPAKICHLADEGDSTLDSKGSVILGKSHPNTDSPCKDEPHASADHTALEHDDCDSGSSDDAASNTGTEDSWAFEPPPLDLNYDALKHIGSYFVPGSHGLCIDISTLRRGQFHEIRVLHFEDGWTCIGRFTREAEPLAKVESELATIEYVRKNTSIPVPQVYLVSHSDNHVVGAPFILMEHIHGSPLDDLWGDLSLDHKLNTIEQIAGIHGQLRI